MLAELHDPSVAAGKKHRPHSFAAPLHRLAGWIRAYLRHRHDRQELFEYLASDHRAAADLGINRDVLRAWSRQPFWQP